MDGSSQLWGASIFSETIDTPHGFCNASKRDPKTARFDHQDLDGLAIRNANRGDSSESIRTIEFRRKKTIFIINVRASRANRPKPANRNLFVAWDAIRKKGVQFGNPETIRVNPAIRANLRIDSRESCNLSTKMCFSKFASLGLCWGSVGLRTLLPTYPTRPLIHCPVPFPFFVGQHMQWVSSTLPSG